MKSVKSCLNKSLGTKKLTYDEFLTVLSEIEKTINNRPLTYVYDELTEEPLTPNHLLYGRRINRNYRAFRRQAKTLRNEKYPP